MRIVSFLVMTLSLAYHVTTWADGDEKESVANRKPDAVINVDEGADLATTIGLGNDVHFSRPRSFRTDSFNSEHVEIEPLAADPPENGSPNP